MLTLFQESLSMVKQEEVNFEKIASQITVIQTFKSVLKKTNKEENDLKIDKLKNMNIKLMSQVRDLNKTMEKNIDKVIHHR